jgi:DNA polymerase I-like protein with 3'-5' exonuclease and polymerase domains
MEDWGVLDLEWDGNEPSHPLLLIGWRGVAYTEAEALAGNVFQELRDPAITKVAFTKGDHRELIEHGYEVQGPFHDVQVMAWTYDERTDLNLASVVEMYAGIQLDKRLRRVGGRILFTRDDGIMVPIAEAPLDQLRRYNEGDLMGTEAAYLALLDRLKRSGRYDHWLTRNAPYSDVLLRMELAGLPIDVWRTKLLRKELREQVASENLWLHLDGNLPEEFNLASKDQLVNYLFTEEFEWPTRYRLDKETMRAVKKDGVWPGELPADFEPTKIGREYITGFRRLKGRGLIAHKMTPKCENWKYGPPEGCNHEDQGDCIPSASAKVLRVYNGDDPWVAAFCDCAVKTKALQFLETWLEEVKDGRIHAQFVQTGTDTGRLSSRDPNLQQVPGRGELGKKFRTLFRPPKGWVFLHADFAQIEPRIGAHFSQDPFLLDVFARGLDLYEELTLAVLGDRYPKGTPERQLVRQNYLALSYGAKAAKVRMQLAEEGFRFPLRKVEKVRDGVIETCQGFWDWKDICIAESEERGWIETIGGHRRHIGWVDQDMRWKAENQSVASKIQGSAADITQGTMMVISETLPEVRLVAAVHDELLADLYVVDATERVRAAFQAAGETGHGFVLDNVKLEFEAKYVYNWAEAK